MKKYQADAILRQYVTEVVRKSPEVRGIYIAGSYLGLNPHNVLSHTSDIDLVFIVDPALQTDKIGKIIYQDLLLEISYLDPEDFIDPERFLLTHYIGNALVHDCILYDPENMLIKAQRVIREDFHQLHWVNRRIDEMLNRIRINIRQFHADIKSPTSMNNYLFTLGISVFPFLLADRRNLTVRKRYFVARQVLYEYGFESLYQSLIDLIAGEMSRSQLMAHMGILENVYDHAARSEGDSAKYAYRQDIRPHTRQIAINGCYELAATEYPKDSVFWIGVTFSRCYTILQLDQPDVRPEALIHFMADTGINTTADMCKQLDALLQLLPTIDEAAKDIAIRSKNHQPQISKAHQS